jgi:GNAT superfamily N-acetyltransferase
MLSVLMRIELIAPDDTKGLLACHELCRAAHDVDDPEGRQVPAGLFKVWATIGWDGTPRELWTARDDDGALLGYCLLVFNDKENLHRLYTDLVVHPAVRRRGIGRALLAHARDRAAADNRTMLAGSAWQGSAGEGFAATIGAARALAEIRRVQTLADIEPGTLNRLRAEASQSSAGYSVVSWREPIPEQYIEPMVAVLAGFEDAPRSENSEKAEWSAERIRDEISYFMKTGQRGYTTVARHDATGTLAAASSVYIWPDDPVWAAQGFTAVVREHRGHRLGLLTKIAMLDWLAEAEPQVTHIETWNAEVNSYMIAVNQALGYRVLGPPNQGWELTLAG